MVRFRRRRAVREASAKVDARGDRLFVTSWSQDDIGLWRANGWFAELDRNADAATVGAAVAEALDRSGQRIETSDDPMQAVVRAAGAKTWGQYIKGVRSASVDSEDRTITVTPLQNRGPREGLTELTASARKLDDPVAEELGAAVRAALTDAVADGEPVTATPAGAPVGWGYKSSWLALRTEDTRGVAEALALADVRPATWREGVDERDDDSVFVTPPVDGWTLVLLGLQAEPDLDALSRAFGEAQLFATHRVTEYHEWQRWIDGDPVRRYCWIGESGEIPFDDGEPAAAEQGLVRASDLDGDWDELEFADEQTVLDVAREWSVDPMTLAARTDVGDGGIVGRLRRSSEL